MGTPVPPDSLLFAQRRGENLPQNNTDILHGVVQIHIQITLGLHLEVKQPMTAEKIQHVIKKWNPCLHLGLTLAVHHQLDGNLRLARFAELLGLPFSLGAHRTRVSTESAWASSRSSRAKALAARTDFLTAAAPYSTTLTRFTKSSTRSPANVRPAPPVGRV